jgi:hypothetical protein
VALARNRTPIEPYLLDIKDSAAFISSGEVHIRELIDQGVLDACKDGNRTRVFVPSLRAYADSLPKAKPQPLASTPNGRKCIERRCAERENDSAA